MAEKKKYSLRAAPAGIASVIDYEKELNEQQFNVVSAGTGPKLVIAGAGSGKTRVVTYRVAWLLEHKTRPQNILLVTFTNKAAREMMHRVALLTGLDVRRMWGGTFHHIGNMILRLHADLLNYNASFSILDREDRKDLMSTCLHELNMKVDKKMFPSPEILSEILSLTHNTAKNTETILELRFPQFFHLIGEIEKIFAHYEAKKRATNSVDYDDLLLLWKQLLEERKKICTLYASMFTHILVDEYQDTNLLQAEIIDLLSGENRNPMVVGDDSQSIYSFRGANFENIIRFPERYPDCVIYKLEINYRSRPEILDLANQIIIHNAKQFHKELSAVRSTGNKPALVVLRDPAQQAEFISQRVLELYEEGISLRDMAILYRAHYHSLELQMELTRRRIPFIISSGLRFFEHRHIKDVVSYIKIIENTYDELSWKRLLKLQSGIGNQIAEKIWQSVKAMSNAMAHLDQFKELIPRKAEYDWDILKKLLEQLSENKVKKNPALMIELVLNTQYKEYAKYTFPDYAARLEDLEQLRNFASQYEDTTRFLSELSLLGNVESEDVLFGSEENDRLKLSTVHQAKGLEWKVVFLVWLTEGKFPSARALRDLDGEEEERRLFYVAVTRCKDELYLLYPSVSWDYSKRLMLQHPSRFLAEIDPDYFQRWDIDLLYEEE